jgi:hypothetical protein
VAEIAGVVVVIHHTGEPTFANYGKYEATSGHTCSGTTLLKAL